MSNYATKQKNKSKKSSNKLSENKYQTLKLGFNKRATNIPVPAQNLEFKITFDEKDLDIIYSHREKKIVEILIRRHETETNCVVLSYNIDTRTIQLESLLEKAALDDKCRLNKSGSYYIDIIFMVIKLLQSYSGKIGFSPCLIELYDTAAKKVFLFDPKPKRLSVYKLLMDGRTFYEGYGFIPTEITDCASPVNYSKLEKLISIRYQILNLYITRLADYIKSILPPDIESDDEIFSDIDKIINLAKQLQNEINDKQNLLDKSLSDLFKLIMIKDDDQSLVEQNLCIAIYNFAAKQVFNLFGTLGLVESSPRVYSYIITPDNTHYAKVDAIYDKYDIQRYDEYSRYLQIKPTERPKKPVTN